MSGHLIQSVRISPEELQDLLDYLDAWEMGAAVEQRRSARRSYRSGRVLVRVLTRESGVDAKFRVTARNISAGGLAFLHGQMLPVDTRLRIEIPQAGDRTLRLVGRVVRCRHVRGMVHEVGVQFLTTWDVPGAAVRGRRNAQT